MLGLSESLRNPALVKIFQGSLRIFLMIFIKIFRDPGQGHQSFCKILKDPWGYKLLQDFEYCWNIIEESYGQSLYLDKKTLENLWGIQMKIFYRYLKILEKFPLGLHTRKFIIDIIVICLVNETYVHVIWELYKSYCPKIKGDFFFALSFK